MTFFEEIGRMQRHKLVTKVPAQSLDYFRPASLDIHFQLPRDEAEFSRVFPEASYSSARKKEVDAVRRKLTSAADPASSSPPISFKEALERSEAGYVALVGHNRDGRFVFLDGSDYGLTALADLCDQLRKNCIFISCQSAKFVSGRTATGMRKNLTFEEGIAIAEGIDTFIAKHREAGVVSTRQVEAFLVEEERRARRKTITSYAIKTSTAAAAGAGSVAIVVGGGEGSFLKRQKRDRAN